MVKSGTWEALQDAIFVCLEERDILQFELNGLLLGALVRSR